MSTGRVSTPSFSKAFATMSCCLPMSTVGGLVGCMMHAFIAIRLWRHLESLPPVFHAIGENSYPLSVSLMVPYKDTLTNRQQVCSNRLSMARQCIERSFALLKCRWKYVDASDMEFLCDIVLASCVLHNLCHLNDSTEDMLSGAVGVDDIPQPESEALNPTQASVV